MIFSSVAYAQAATAAGPGLMEVVFPFLAFIVVIYFLILRPQQKRMKEHQNMLNNLKRGDQVLTTGGIYGVVTGQNDRFVTLEIDENVKVKVLKSQVQGYVKEGVS